MNNWGSRRRLALTSLPLAKIFVTSRTDGGATLADKSPHTPAFGSTWATPGSRLGLLGGVAQQAAAETVARLTSALREDNLNLFFCAIIFQDALIEMCRLWCKN